MTMVLAVDESACEMLEKVVDVAVLEIDLAQHVGDLVGLGGAALRDVLDDDDVADEVRLAALGL
jgi:hypothetical protein